MTEAKAAIFGLTPHLLYLIARCLDRKQRAVLRLCGRQLRRAANECVKTVRLSKHHLMLWPPSQLELLVKCFPRAQRLALHGRFTNEDYSWLLATMGCAEFLAGLHEVDMSEAPVNDLFLCSIVNYAKGIQSLQASAGDAVLHLMERSLGLKMLRDLELSYYGSQRFISSLTWLSGLPSLESLNLEAFMKADVLKTLPGELTTLKTLKLRSKGEEPLDLAPLHGRTHLEVLHLETPLGPRSFDQLLQLDQQLKELRLQLKAADQDAADELADVLPRLSELESLQALALPQDSGLTPAGLHMVWPWQLPAGLTKLLAMDRLAIDADSIIQVCLLACIHLPAAWQVVMLPDP